MIHDKVDSILIKWADAKKLKLQTQYKDSEVRSFTVVGSTGKSSQIWLDTPDPNEGILVHVWNYSDQHTTFNTNVDALESTLDAAYSEALTQTAK
jgi:hypothetical protein